MQNNTIQILLRVAGYAELAIYNKEPSVKRFHAASGYNFYCYEDSDYSLTPSRPSDSYALALVDKALIRDIIYGVFEPTGG